MYPRYIEYLPKISIDLINITLSAEKVNWILNKPLQILRENFSLYAYVENTMKNIA